MRSGPFTLYGLDDLGNAALGEAAGWWRSLHFGAMTLVTGLTPSAWDASMRATAARQVYFSAWQVLGGFTLAAAISAWVLIRITIAAARDYGLDPYVIDLVMRVLVLELIPVGTAVFVGLRSGSAISTEVAIFHARGDLQALERAGGDPLRHELVPRVIASAVAVTALGLLNAGIAMGMLYFMNFGLSPAGLPVYLRETGEVLKPVIAAGAMLKMLLLGAAVAIFPITAAVSMPRDMRLVPIAVRDGMVRLMVALAVIEGAFLVAVYA